MEENKTIDQPSVELTPTSALNILINLGQVCLQSGVFSNDDSVMIYNSLRTFEKKMEEGEDFTIRVKADDVQM